MTMPMTEDDFELSQVTLNRSLPQVPTTGAYDIGGARLGGTRAPVGRAASAVGGVERAV